jgi:predicted DsbA family dithiol-disulfide isomerase
VKSAPVTLSIEVSFDLICPWCLIGKRHLDTAIAQLREEQPQVDVAVEWRSFPLIPGTPLAGVSYREFYVARLGSPEAVAIRQGQVRAAAQEAGLTLAFDKIRMFPNTLLAHRLVRFAREAHGADAASRLVEDLFTRYFLQGEDIGDAQVLRAAVRACGIATPGDADAPLHHELPWLPAPQAPEDAFHGGGTGVPHFLFDEALALSGAHPPEVLLEAMRRAIARRAIAA